MGCGEWGAVGFGGEGRGLGGGREREVEKGKDGLSVLWR